MYFTTPFPIAESPSGDNSAKNDSNSHKTHRIHDRTQKEN